MTASGPARGRVVSVNLSAEKGVAKEAVPAAEFRPELGVVGDAHAGPGLRQVSLLALESIERQRQVFQERRASGEEEQCGKGYDLSRELRPGGFAENLTISGIALAQLPLGIRLRVGKEVVLEVSKIGKECHLGCAIFELLGDCVMPREGVFARVISGGVVHQGDEVLVDARGDSHHQ